MLQYRHNLTLGLNKLYCIIACNMWLNNRNIVENIASYEFLLSYNTSDRDELERKSAKLKLRLGCFETSTTCSTTGNENPLVIVKPTDKKFDTNLDVCHQAPSESPLRNLRKRNSQNVIERPRSSGERY